MRSPGLLVVDGACGLVEAGVSKTPQGLRVHPKGGVKQDLKPRIEHQEIEDQK